MAKDTRQPVVYGIIHTDQADWPFRCYSWFAFMAKINEIMRETEIKFPLGEDEEIKMVTQKISKIERFKS